jgi:GNAT superfamily N-acetyltransferase
MAEPTVTLTDEPDDADIAVVADGLRDYNTAQAGYDDYRRIAIFVTDPESGAVLGGIYGGSYMGQMSIERVFLPETLRGDRLGSRLIKMAEDEARRRGCSRLTLNTMEIQAQGFYLKLGFETAAALTCDPPGINRYVMTKKLT